jgi:3-methyladenine DNA glycosylase AlkD
VPKREFRLVLRAELALRRNPEKAAAMQAYMKSAMPYLGIQTPQLRAICKRLFAAHPIQTAVAWRKTCLGIWRGAKYREERYAAIGLTGYRLYRTFQTLATLPMYEEMIVTGAWWDFVDEIASRRLGPLLQLYPQPMRGEMLRWSRSENLWKRRSAILCQLSFKQKTDSLSCMPASSRRSTRVNSFCRKPSDGRSANTPGRARARSAATSARMQIN